MREMFVKHAEKHTCSHPVFPEMHKFCPAQLVFTLYPCPPPTYTIPGPPVTCRHRVLQPLSKRAIWSLRFQPDRQMRWWWQLKGTCDVEHIEKVEYTNQNGGEQSWHRGNSQWNKMYGNRNAIIMIISLTFLNDHLWNHKFYWSIMWSIIWVLQSRCMTSLQTPLFKCHSSVVYGCSCNHFALNGPFHC